MKGEITRMIKWGHKRTSKLTYYYLTTSFITSPSPSFPLYSLLFRSFPAIRKNSEWKTEKEATKIDAVTDCALLFEFLLFSLPSLRGKEKRFWLAVKVVGGLTVGTINTAADWLIVCTRRPDWTAGSSMLEGGSSFLPMTFFPFLVLFPPFVL